MNGYICVYQGNQYEVRANNPYAAQCEAAKLIQRKNPRRKVKHYDISVCLAERDGNPVTHTFS